VTGIELFSAGDFLGGPGTEAITLHDPEAGVYRKVVLQADRVVGAVLYGDAEGATWLTDLIAATTDMSAIRDALAFGPEVAALLAPPPVPELADGAARKAA
jgi:nitrite reductase (NADH) large subunit